MQRLQSQLFVLITCVGLLMSVCSQSFAARPNSVKQQHAYMVKEYIIKEGIKNKRVIQAMATVPRHEFVPRGQRMFSYSDNALPIGFKQTISPPFIVAYMTEILDPQPTDIVLEIGTGSGYQAAVLSGLVKEVYSIEIVKPLGLRAKTVLKKLKYKNVITKVGDGYKGWKEHGPFDKIIVTCSPESIPKALVRQLREGGKMIIPIGERYQQVFHLLEKKDGKLKQTKLLPTLFVPMTGQSEKERMIKPNPMSPRINNGGFEKDSNNDGFIDSWHYQRRSKVKTDSPPEGENYLHFKTDKTGLSAHILQGMAISGKRIQAVRITLSVKTKNIQNGEKIYEKPRLIMYFFDRNRKPVATQISKPWKEIEKWETKTITLLVPPNAVEAIIQTGLNGASGELSIDNLQIKVRYR